jgi:hypothetical protein
MHLVEVCMGISSSDLPMLFARSVPFPHPLVEQQIWTFLTVLARNTDTGFPRLGYCNLQPPILSFQGISNCSRIGILHPDQLTPVP